VFTSTQEPHCVMDRARIASAPPVAAIVTPLLLRVNGGIGA